MSTRVGGMEHGHVYLSQYSFRHHVASLPPLQAGGVRLALWDMASWDV